MLNDKLNYPYPVIRPNTDDYVTTVFKGDLQVTPEPDGFYIHPKFSVNNIEINNMIEEGILTYAIEIECAATWYRQLILIKENSDYKIEPALVHETVELTPCIIATEKIQDFTNSDFDEEYGSIKYNLNPGEVVGVGDKKAFDAFYKDDIIKSGSSIIHCKGNDDVKELSLDFAGALIQVTMPKEQFLVYNKCGHNKNNHVVLNAVLSIPILVEAITIIRDDEKYPDRKSGFEKNAWYKTIVVNLKRYAENNENKYKKLLDNPFSSAEILLGNNYAMALSFLNSDEQ